MPTTVPSRLFALMVPTTDQGPTHAAPLDGPGFLCGARTGRQTFTMMGVVPGSSATCEDCQDAAAAIHECDVLADQGRHEEALRD